MKNFIIVFGLVLILIIGVVLIPQKENNYDYLRLHIRANSNTHVDQNLKYKIKDEMLQFLTPLLVNVESKENAIKIIENNSQKIQKKCLKIVRNNGFNYSVNIAIKNEYFPTRSYNNTTLESGYYDAVIVELGKAEGNNWWCVMYPPLCFVNKNENLNQIKYKSKIYEWFEKIFKK